VKAAARFTVPGSVEQ